jgi:hypothetical protein
MQKIIIESEFEFEIPSGFDEEPYDAKGYYYGSMLIYRGNIYELIFYDIERFLQTIQSELSESVCYFESNVLLIKKISIENMEMAVRHLKNTGQIERLAPQIKLVS